MRRARVTIIDDDPDSRDVMTEILRSEGYEVASFGSVSATLEEVIGSRPGLLIVDLHLVPLATQLSGWDVVRLAKANRDLHAVPILVVSADLPRLHGLIPDTMAFADVFLLGKPFALDSLTVMARMALASGQHAPPFVQAAVDRRAEHAS